jgi:PLP dependent protein
MESPSDRLIRVTERIDNAARRAGRQAQDITLVAVTKTISLEQIFPFVRAGVRHLGENRVQEALAKFQTADSARPVEAQIHLIGHLQTNKAKKAAGFFDMIQSVDSLELADDLDRHAQAMNKVLPCLVEVKISSEPTKSGVAPEALDEFLTQLKTRTSLAVRGLMGIPPLGTEGDAARPFFVKLRQMFEKSRLEILSMGMSVDFEQAIEEGSTMVRIGTALFGARA